MFCQGLKLTSAPAFWEILVHTLKKILVCGKVWSVNLFDVLHVKESKWLYVKILQYDTSGSIGEKQSYNDD